VRLVQGIYYIAEILRYIIGIIATDGVKYFLAWRLLGLRAKQSPERGDSIIISPQITTMKSVQLFVVLALCFVVFGRSLGVRRVSSQRRGNVAAKSLRTPTILRMTTTTEPLVAEYEAVKQQVSIDKPGGDSQHFP